MILDIPVQRLKKKKVLVNPCAFLPLTCTKYQYKFLKGSDDVV